MELKESLKKITQLNNMIAPEGWNTVNSHNRLNYNDMTFIPALKKHTANRILNNVPTLDETIKKLSTFVSTIVSTDIETLNTEFDIDIYASKVYPNEMEKKNIKVMTDLQKEVNLAWIDFYTAELNGSSRFPKNDSDVFIKQSQTINEIAKRLEAEHVNINKFLMFNYTLTNQLAISILHDDDKSYVVNSIKKFIETNAPNMDSFKQIYIDYQEANKKFLLDIKSAITEVSPSTFITNADFFIDRIGNNADSSSVESFLIEKMLTYDDVFTCIEFTAAQKINKVILFDDSSIAYKKNGQYQTIKDTDTLKEFIKDLHDDALSYIFRKKPKMISFFQNKLNEDKNYNNAISSATSFLDNYAILKQYDFDLTSFTNKSFEAIDDDINNIVNKNKVKQFAFSILSSKYKHLFNENTEPHFKSLLDNGITTSQLQNFVGKKLAALNSNEDVILMLTGILNHFDGFTQDALTHKLENLGIKKIYDENNVVTFEVDSYKQCKELGSTSWCIVRDESYFDQYVTDQNNRQYIVYDFNKTSTENASMIGFTVESDGRIYAEHLKNDDSIESYNKDEKLENIQNHTIYKNKNRHKLSEETIFALEEIVNFEEAPKISKPLKMRNI